MSKCVQCGKVLGPLDIYQETAEGVVCGGCLLHAVPGAQATRPTRPARRHAARPRGYSVTEQAFLPIGPAGVPARRGVEG
ncbi:MAG: hypothetical protein H0S85_16365 [Desulfovibrionaceae bacterium]|jgi:hypothetical protein|nr:hypothetical protein [Desulfovibrionaceae bacterium]